MENDLLAMKGWIVAGWLLALVLAERLIRGTGARLPDRAEWRRWRRNLGLWLPNLPGSLIVVVPITAGAAAIAPPWREAMGWSGAPALIVDLLLLDLWIYGWHRANHRLGFLWRFHHVHHRDARLDASSALRFHFGEVWLAACARAPVIIALDIPLAHVLAFETLVLLAALFHHSAIRLPARVDRALARVIVTPGLHHVHHHPVRADTDSNYGTILTLWDRLFGSLNRRTAWPGMPIGSPDAPETGLFALLVAPARRTESARGACNSDPPSST